MKTIWLEVDIAEFLTDEFFAFSSFLDVYDMKRTVYVVDSIATFKITGKMTDEFNKRLSEFMYYHPIEQLEKEPEVSDYNIWEEMSSKE